MGKIILWGASRVRALDERHRAIFTVWAALAIVTFSYLLEPMVMGGGTELISRLLFEDGVDASWALLVGRFVAPILCVLTGSAAGLMAPSLAAGAVMGGRLAEIANAGNPRLMMVLGMIGFLSGVTRAPFTAFVLVLEMTDRHSAIFPMMISSIVASGISRLIDSKSFYDHRREDYGK